MICSPRHALRTRTTLVCRHNHVRRTRTTLVGANQGTHGQGQRTVRLPGVHPAGHTSPWLSVCWNCTRRECSGEGASDIYDDKETQRHTWETDRHRQRTDSRGHGGRNSTRRKERGRQHGSAAHTAAMRRSVSSTERPTGRSFIVIWRRMPLGSMMNRPADGVRGDQVGQWPTTTGAG